MLSQVAHYSARYQGTLVDDQLPSREILFIRFLIDIASCPGREAGKVQSCPRECRWKVCYRNLIHAVLGRDGQERTISCVCPLVQLPVCYVGGIGCEAVELVFAAENRGSSFDGCH